MPTTPSVTTVTSSAPCNHSSGRTDLGLRSAGSAESASTAPPTGSTAAPVKAITPFGDQHSGRRKAMHGQNPGHRGEGRAEQYGVAVSAACSTIVRASAAAAAASEPKAMNPKWVQLLNWTPVREEMQDRERPARARGDENGKADQPAAEQKLHGPWYRLT